MVPPWSAGCCPQPPTLGDQQLVGLGQQRRAEAVEDRLRPDPGPLDLPAAAGPLDVAAGLALRQPIPASQSPCRLGDVVAGGQQRHRGVDPLRPLVGTSPSTGRHDARILPLVSNGAPRPLTSLIGQGNLKLEVAYCVGGVSTPPCGVPASLRCGDPSCITPARNSTRRSAKTARSLTRSSTACSNPECGIASKQFATSVSTT